MSIPAALVAAALLSVLAVAAPVSASSQQLPRGEPAFTEDQLKRLPPGVTVQPDGTVLKDGKPTGLTLLPDTPKRRKERKMARFASTWKPFFFYLNDSALFSPLSLEEVAGPLAPGQRITALAAASGGRTLAYAVTERDESVILLQDLDQGVRQALVRASQLSPGLWFHDPASMSPDRRWLLVAASGGLSPELMSQEGAMETAENAAGDVWLLDCTSQTPPRRVLSQQQIRSFAWSPDGKRAVCQVSPAPSGQTSAKLLLLETQSGETHQLPVAELDHLAQVAWMADGSEILLLPEPGRGEDGISYHLGSGKLTRFALGVPQVGNAEGLWSPDGTRAALLSRESDSPALRLLRQTGGGRTCATPQGASSLLGWSDCAQLLAYLSEEGALSFCSGAVDEGDYARLISAHPAELLVHDESRPGPYKSAREHISLDTISSPLKPVLSAHPRLVWLTTEDGPCLVYLEAGEQGETLRALRFRRMSLVDLGLDPRGDLRAQIIRQEFNERMVALDNALTAYVRAHDGNLPSHSEGKELQEELRPYLRDPGGLFGGEKTRLRLLIYGVNVKELLPKLQDGGRIRVAELHSDGQECVVYAVLSGPPSLEESLGALPTLPVNFQAVLASEEPSLPADQP